MNKALKIAIVVVLCLIVILTITLFACQSDSGKTTTTTTTTQPTTSSTTSSTSGNGGDVDPNPDCTEHKDENKDYICDVCEAELEKPACTEHKDENKDEKCDVCGEKVEKPACTEHVDADKNGKCDECDAAVEQDEPEKPAEFTETNDKVYVITSSLVVRTAPDDKEETIFDWVNIDTELKRVGYTADGWSKITYKSKECYVATACVTTSKPITSFSNVQETVYFINSAYAFTRPSHLEDYDYSVADFDFQIGESVTRTGVAKEEYVAADGKKYTFARIEFEVTNNGEKEKVVRYVNNDYLSTSKENPDGDIKFANSDDVLVANGDQWLRKSTVFEDSERVTYITKGTELTAIGKGTEKDGTIWYKVKYEGEIRYVIFQAKDKAPYFTIKGADAE